MQYYKTLKNFKDYSQAKEFDLSDLDCKEADFKSCWVNFYEKTQSHYPVIEPAGMHEDSEKIMRYFWCKYPCTYARYVFYSKALFFNFILFLLRLEQETEENTIRFLGTYSLQERKKNPIKTYDSAYRFGKEQAWTDLYSRMDAYFTDPQNITIFEAINNPLYKDGLEGEGMYAHFGDTTPFDCENIAWDGDFRGVHFNIRLKEGNVAGYEHMKGTALGIPQESPLAYHTNIRKHLI